MHYVRGSNVGIGTSTSTNHVDVVVPGPLWPFEPSDEGDVGRGYVGDGDVFDDVVVASEVAVVGVVEVVVVEVVVVVVVIVGSVDTKRTADADASAEPTPTRTRTTARSQFDAPCTHSGASSWRISAPFASATRFAAAPGATRSPAAARATASAAAWAFARSVAVRPSCANPNPNIPATTNTPAANTVTDPCSTAFDRSARMQ